MRKFQVFGGHHVLFMLIDCMSLEKIIVFFAIVCSTLSFPSFLHLFSRSALMLSRVSSLSSIFSLYPSQRSHFTAPVKSITGQTFLSVSKASAERGCFCVVKDSWLDTRQCVLRTRFHFLIYTMHSFMQSIRLLIIRSYIADTRDLSGLMHSSTLMLL